VEDNHEIFEGVQQGRCKKVWHEHETSPLSDQNHDRLQVVHEHFQLCLGVAQGDSLQRFLPRAD